MKISEVIDLLQVMLDTHGDKVVMVFEDGRDFKAVEKIEYQPPMIDFYLPINDTVIIE